MNKLTSLTISLLPYSVFIVISAIIFYEYFLNSLGIRFHFGFDFIYLMYGGIFYQLIIILIFALKKNYKLMKRSIVILIVFVIVIYPITQFKIEK